MPIASHDAVAYDLGRAVIVVTDARRNEIAFSEYGEPDADGFPQRVRGPGAAAARRARQPAARARCTRRSTIPAGALGMLAERAFAAGRLFGPGGLAATAEPLYLRQPDVTISAGPKRVTG